MVAKRSKAGWSLWPCNGLGGLLHGLDQAVAATVAKTILQAFHAIFLVCTPRSKTGAKFD